MDGEKVAELDADVEYAGDKEVVTECVSVSDPELDAVNDSEGEVDVDGEAEAVDVGE